MRPVDGLGSYSPIVAEVFWFWARLVESYLRDRIFGAHSSRNCGAAARTASERAAAPRLDLHLGFGYSFYTRVLETTHDSALTPAAWLIFLVVRVRFGARSSVTGKNAVNGGLGVCEQAVPRDKFAPVLVYPPREESPVPILPRGTHAPSRCLNPRTPLPHGPKSGLWRLF